MTSSTDDLLGKLAEARDAGSTLGFLREMHSVMTSVGQILDSAIEGSYESDCGEEITEALESMKQQNDSVMELAEAQRRELDEGEDDDDDEAIAG